LGLSSLKNVLYTNSDYTPTGIRTQVNAYFSLLPLSFGQPTLFFPLAKAFAFTGVANSIRNIAEKEKGGEKALCLTAALLGRLFLFLFACFAGSF